MPDIMIVFNPTIPGPYYVGTDLTLRCTVTLDPDDNNYEHVNTWMTGPFYSDDNATPITRSQGRYTRRVSFGCISDQREGNHTCRAGLIDNPDVEANATINIEILGMCTLTSYLNQYKYSILFSTDLPSPVVSIIQTSGQPTAGQSYSLICSVQTFQTPITTHYIWTDMSSGQVSGSSVLSFDPLRTSDGGQYTCTVTVGECEIQSVTGEKSTQLIIASKYIIISW